MPKIPTGPGPQFVQPVTSEETARQLGAPRIKAQDPGAALANLGKSIGGLGKAVGRIDDVEQAIAQKEKTAKDREFGLRAAIEDNSAIAEFKQEDIRSQGHSGHEERMRTFIDERKVEREFDAPSPEAFVDYESRALRSHLKGGLDAKNTERSGNILQAKSVIGEKFNEAAGAQLQTPDLKSAIESVELLDEYIENQKGQDLFAPGEAEKISRDGKAAIMDAHFTGLLQTASGKNNNIATGLSLLEKPGSGLVKLLGKKQLEDQLGKFRRAEGTETTIKESEVSANVSDFIAAKKEGIAVPKSQGIELISQINTLKDKDKSRRLLNKMNAVIFASGGAEQLTLARPEDFQKIEDATFKGVQGAPGIKGAAFEADMRRFFKQKRDENLKMREENPHALVVDAVPSFKEEEAQIEELKQKAALMGDRPEAKQFLEEAFQMNQVLVANSLAMQSKMGIADPRVTRPEKAKELAASITEQDQPENIAGQMELIQAEYGGATKKVIDEMIKADSRTAGVALGMYFPDRESKGKIAALAINEKVINEQFTDVRPDIMRKDLNGVVSEKMDEIKSSLTLGTNSTSRIPMSQGFRNTLETEVKRAMAQDIELALDDAVDTAFAELMEKNFAVVAGGRSTLMIPRDEVARGADPDKIEAFVGFVSEPETLARISPVPPEAKSKALRGTLTDEQIKEQWVINLTSTHRWIMNDAQDGVILMYDPPGQKPVMVRDAEGGTISFSYQEITEGVPAIEKLKGERAKELEGVFTRFGTRGRGG